MLLATSSRGGYPATRPRDPCRCDRLRKRFLEGQEIKPPLFALNPFSSKGTDFKRWPMDRYAELIRAYGQ